MGGTEGQLAQVSPCLVPTFMVNTQHQVKHRPAGKPSYGNRHCRSKYFNYGSQTGRGLRYRAILCSTRTRSWRSRSAAPEGTLNTQAAAAAAAAALLSSARAMYRSWWRAAAAARAAAT